MPDRSSPAPPTPRDGGAHLFLPVDGMHCASCVGRIERALGQVPGVARATVNLAGAQADIVVTGAGPDLAALRRAVGDSGFTVPLERQELAIEGMTCASCVGRIEKTLRAVPGVAQAEVDLASARARVDGVRGLEAGALVAAIRKAGYRARPVVETDAQPADATRQARAREFQALRRATVLAGALTLPVMVLEMGAHLVPGMAGWLDASIGRQVNWTIQFALTTAVLAGPGRGFFTAGLPALLRRAPDMNALVALGTGAAWAFSTLAVFAGDMLPAGTRAVYFEAAAVIVTLILLGRTLEAAAKGRTGAAIEKLMGLRPKTARVLRDGTAREIPLDTVVPGDIVQLRPGDKVPVDGTVLDGRSYVDEAMLTGEPEPVLKQAGADIVAGTLTKTGTLTFRASRVGADTVLAQIVRMVERAQGAKLPIQALVDKVTGVFVPVVMGVAALTFAVWAVFGPAPALGFALVNAVAVLIVACPCAMGLATPTSIMVGTGRAAELGVLFRQGQALQILRDVTVVAFDKTGTLTKGKPEVTDLIPARGHDADAVLALAAAAERHSEHPLGAAIVTAAEARGLAIPAATDFEAVPGFGLTARVEDRGLAIGADRFMARLGLDVAAFADDAARLADEGKTPLYVAVDGVPAAVLAVADPIKPGAAEALAALHGEGLKSVMLTGDNRRTAEAIARRLGIDTVVAETLPDGKVAALETLGAEGGKIAFVGDGINDAPALAAADIGIAIGTGTDVAIEAADVVLMSGDLTKVPAAIAVSRATLANIKQNLFWAFAYNASLIPVAAGVLYPAFGILLSPILAAGAMAASSVCVVTNALRLRRFRPPTAR